MEMKKDTRSEILRIGTELIVRQGFTATGIDSVLKEAGVPKGSFYHFFKSKEEFGLAVIDLFAERYDQRLESFLNDGKVAPLKRIRNYLESGLEKITQNNCTCGCLIGNLGQEMADVNERFRERLDEVFRSWKGRFAACIGEAQEKGDVAADLDPEVTAGFILSGWEGAILRTKVMKSPKPLHDFMAVLFTAVLRQ